MEHRIHSESKRNFSHLSGKRQTERAASRVGRLSRSQPPLKRHRRLGVILLTAAGGNTPAADLVSLSVHNVFSSTVLRIGKTGWFFFFIQNIWLSVTEISPRPFFCRQCLSLRFIKEPQWATVTYRVAPQKQVQGREILWRFHRVTCHCWQSVRLSPFCERVCLPSRQELPPSCSGFPGLSRKLRCGGSFLKRKSWLHRCQSSEAGEGALSSSGAGCVDSREVGGKSKKKKAKNQAG